jgi:hypothetical protein
MTIALGLVVLLWPLLVVLTVLASLGWLVLAVLASLGWIVQRLLRATVRGGTERVTHRPGGGCRRRVVLAL